MAFDYLKYICDLKKKDYDESGCQLIYSDYKLEEIMLPMLDGIRLRTLIYRPVDEQGTPIAAALPVIIERSCYPQQAPISKIHGEQLTKRGYIFISQYCRGTGGSEGEWEPNVNERADGLTTLQWLEEQAWVDVIGYWGNSYLSLTGWAIADQVPEKVKGMCLTHYGTDRFHSAYEKGMFRQDVLTSWAMENTGYPVQADYMETCRFMPQVEVDERLWGRRVAWYRDWITNTKREDSYWQQGWWKELFDIPSRVKVPLYIRSGWYDHHHGSSMNTWNQLGKETKKHCWLDMGGWNHGFMPCLEDCKTEQLQSSDVHAILRWFDLVLKKKQLPEQQIRAYVIGADRWVDLEEWPIQDKERQLIYLETGDQEKQGSLKEEPVSEAVSFTYQYDPKDPVPSYGGEALLKSMQKNGSLVQPEPGYRPDIISFLSEPLREDLSVIGKIKVYLYVSSDCPDTAFTAKLMEQRENGKYYNIRSSITSLCQDMGRSYQPGDIEQVTIEMWDISYQIKKGSRLRLDLSSSDFPQYHIHSNYAGIWSMQEATQKAVQNIYCGKMFPSAIDIPWKVLS